MTVGEWLDTRTPQPPPALRARIDDALGAALHADAAEAPDRLQQTGRALAASLLARGSTQRDSALDLLAADALVTYAFEAASEQPATLTTRAAAAMASIAALAATAPPDRP